MLTTESQSICTGNLVMTPDFKFHTNIYMHVDLRVLSTDKSEKVYK